MALAPGTRLGPYEVTALIGEGGMGQVYHARDTELDRDVALKILPDEFTRDPDRLARFQREAKTLAALNHPNIAQIYGVERSDGVQALVMELVDGEDLSQRLARGPVPLDEALPIARQIAEALEAAHEAGIIHRDLKPANIKVRADGTVKVLDFGLAKAVEAGSGNRQPASDNRTPADAWSKSPTITSPVGTMPGIILGTAAYMSPEQARGKPVDKRTDIWAFGCVLYEMLTGKRAFPGEDVSETLATVIKGEPGWEQLPPATPPNLRQILRACLQKNPRERMHDMADVRLLMDAAFETPAPSVLPVPAPPPKLRLWQRPHGALAAAVMLTALASAGAWWLTLQGPTLQPIVRFTTPPPDGYLFVNSQNYTDLAVSPDGARVIYRVVPPGGSQGGTRMQLYLRALDQVEGIVLRGTEGANEPFFSPDGEWVGFIAENNTALKKLSLSAGSQWYIATLDSEVRGASWGSDDRIVYATNTGQLFRVPAGGGEPELLRNRGSNDTEWGPGRFLWPEVLPGSGAVLVTWDPDGGVDDMQIAVLDLSTGRQKLLVPRGSHPRYSPTGHLLYAAGGTLWAVGFDVGRLKVAGDPVPMVQGVTTKIGGAATFAFSMDHRGTLAYSTGLSASGRSRTLVWVDRQGREEALTADPGPYDLPRLSPDGRRVALEVEHFDNTDVYVYDLERDVLTRLTTDPARDLSPVWAPDGKTVVFGSTRDGGGIFVKAADGSGQATRFAPARIGGGEPLPHTWARDGTLVFYVSGGPTLGDVFTLSPHAERAEPLLADPKTYEGHPAMSPDGRWLAYTSDVSGVQEIYVVPFPNVRERQLQITQGGAREAVWAPDGRALVYRPQGTLGLTAVPIETDPALRAGRPERLFEGSYEFPQAGRHYDISSDGQRFLMLKTAGSTDTAMTDSQVTVVLNFFDELRARVP